MTTDRAIQPGDGDQFGTFQPLTAAQEGIWVGQQLSPLSPNYNSAELTWIEGDLNVNAFIEAATSVIRDADCLHTSFETVAGLPTQRSRPATGSIESIDVTTATNPDEAAREWARRDNDTVCDLAKGPIHHSALVRVAQKRWAWYLKIHHIAADGYAFALLRAKVAETYCSLTDARNGSVNSFGSYQNIVTAEASYPGSEAFDNDRAFWLDQLRERRRPISFSPSNAVSPDRPSRLTSQLDSTVCNALIETARDRRATWSDALIAAVATALYCRTNTTEITIGMPISQRFGTPAANVPCMKMNIVPVPLCVPDDASAGYLIEHAAQTIANSRQHFRYRYEQLNQDLGKNDPENRAFGPVVNVLPFASIHDFGDCQVSVENLSAGPVDDISFAFTLLPGGDLRFDLDANPNRYSHDQLTEIQVDVLDSVNMTAFRNEEPLTPRLSHLSWLQGPALGLTELSNPTGVLERFLAHSRLRPAALAVKNGETSWSYSELESEVFRIGRALWLRGVGAGETVALALERSEWAVALPLGLFTIGANFVFIDPHGPTSRNWRILDDCLPTLLLVENEEVASSLTKDRIAEESQTGLPPSPSIMTIEKLLSEDTYPLSDSNLEFSAVSEPDQPAYVMYTSGSSGVPKGVVVSHRSLVEFTVGSVDTYGFTSNDRILQFAPFVFDTCIEEIFGTLTSGAALLLRNDAMLDSVPGFLKQCDEWEITVLDLPTAYWHELTFTLAHEVPQRASLPQNLRLVIIGGEPVLPERVNQWRTRVGTGIALLNTYGPTEATVVATCADLSEPEVSISIGQPLPGRQVAIVSDDMRLLPKGQVGELILLGAGLAGQYLNRRSETEESFVNITIPTFDSRRQAYRTGDMARVTCSNQIEFVGRIDDQIKLSGQRIDPGEIEAAIATLPEVREVSVVAQPNGAGATTLVAHVVPADGRESPSCRDSNRLVPAGESMITDDENDVFDIVMLNRSLVHLLSLAMRPTHLVIHAELPKTSSGKVDRSELVDSENVRRFLSDDQQIHELTYQQELVASSWQEILGVSDLNPDDNFFTIGGQSLQSIQVAIRLGIDIGREVPVSTLFEHPTLAGLTKALFSSETSPPTVDGKGLTTAMQSDINDFERTFAASASTNGKEALVDNGDKGRAAVLLTGATGFVGSHLLHQILAHSDYEIKVLVRADSQKHAEERLQKALAAQSLSLNLKGRVTAIVCDLESEQLGLSQQKFDELQNTVDHIIHNAAVVSVLRDYESLRAVNTLATGKLLTLAAARQIPFSLVSTIAVAPPDAPLEEDFIEPHSHLSDGYQQSKWVAERMVQIAASQSLPVTIYRLGRITGAIGTGFVNPTDLVWEILQAGLRNNLLPKLDVTESWTPVDQVAQFVKRDSLTQPGQGVVNVIPQQPVQLRDLARWLRSAGYSFEMATIPEWCDLLRSTPDPRDKKILPFFDRAPKSPKEVDLSAIRNKKFMEKADKLTIEFPEFTSEMFTRYVFYAVEHGILSPPDSLNTLNR